MRILQVVTLARPDFVGGATLACERLARGLAARGHAVAVLSGRPDPALAPYGRSTWELDGLPVTGVHVAAGYDPLAPRSYRHPEAVPALAAALADERPDVVHVHSIQALGADLLALAAARGVPVVLTMHDWWWYCARLFLVDEAGFVCPPRVDPRRCHCAPGVDFTARRAFLDAMLAHADRILTPSRLLAEAVVANGMPRARVAVCPNGIVAPAPGRRRPGPVRFAYVGGPDNRLKGLPCLLAAAAALDAGGWELALHAVDRRAGRIPAVVADRVRAAPPFAPEALGAVLAATDCMIVPSLMRESYSLVTREALAAGVPVIATDCGGPGEVVAPEVNGLLVATGDARDLAAAMRRVVMEPALRERLAAGARATRLPSLAEQVDQTERVYGEVLRARGRPDGRRGPAAPAAPPRPGDEREPRGTSALAAPSDPIAAAEPVAGPSPAADPAATPVAGREPRDTVAAARSGGAVRRVLFLAGIDGAPFRYRVTNLRDRLAARGIAGAALFWTDPGALAAVAAADLVVLYRVPIGAWVRALIAEARRLGRPLAFSCDDLVFERASVPSEALALLPPDQRAGWLAYVDRYAETLCACDAFIGTTEPLVEAAGRMGVRGWVVRNGLGEAQLEVGEEVRKRRLLGERAPARGIAARHDTPAASARTGAPHDARASARHDAPGSNDAVTLAYLSGTTMHDLDFAAIEPALAAVLAARPAVRLRQVGYLRAGPALAAFGDRIERLPFLPWSELFARLDEVDVNLAPLTGRDPFTDAKSEVKYLEAGILGVPTIASPTSAFRRAIADGRNGLLAATAADWEAALLRLIDDAGLRRRLGNAALADAFLHYTPAAQADELVAALEEIAGAAAGARARRPAAAATPAGVEAAPWPESGAPGPAPGATADAEDAGELGSPCHVAGPQDRDIARLRASYPGEVGRHDLEPPDAVAGPAVTSRDSPSPFLLPGRAIGQTFRAARDGLYRLDVCVGTDGKVHDYRLIVHVAERLAPDAPDLRRVVLAAATFADHAWIAAEFPPIADSAGRTLYVWVEAEGATEGDAVTLWTYVEGWGDELPAGLHIDHAPVVGSLTFRTFCRG